MSAFKLPRPAMLFCAASAMLVALSLTGCESLSTPLPPPPPVLVIPPPPSEALKPISDDVKGYSQQASDWRKELTAWQEAVRKFLAELPPKSTP